MVHNSNDGKAIQYAVMRANYLQEHPEHITIEDLILVTAAQALAQEKNMEKSYNTLYSAGDFIERQYTQRQYKHQ